MLKPYDELRKVDVLPFCEERDGMKYLNWAKCIDLLHENGAEIAEFVPVQNENTGSSLIMTDQVFTDRNGVSNRCYETRIAIHIDNKTYYMQSPVMNGSNPVKDNSMSQQRIWNSMCRSFVKGVAIYTGLGFDLWLKEEAKEVTQPEIYHNIIEVRNRVTETITAIQKKYSMTLADIAKTMQRSEEELKSYLGYYKILDAVEHNLDYLLAKGPQNDSQ